MSDPNDPYPIAPTPDEPAGGAPSTPPTPPPSSATPADAEPRAKSADLKAKLNLSGLLENFEEDADFDKDPELEAKILGRPRPSASGSPGTESTGPRPEFVQPGFGQAKHLGIVGAVLMVVAVIFAAVHAGGQPFVRILLTLYETFLHTGTGLVALYLSSRLLETRFGSIELAAGRMYTCVAAFMLVMNLQLAPFHVGWLDWTVTMVAAVAVYAVSLASLFKFWDKQKLGFVGGFHAMLWMVVQVGMELARAVHPVVAPKAGG